MRMIKILTLFLMMILTMIPFTTTIAATPDTTITPEPTSDTYAILKIKINVPKDFKEDINVFFYDTAGGNDYSFTFTHGEDYNGTYGLKRGTVYAVEYDFKSIEKYEIFNIEKNFDTIKTGNFTCDWNLKNRINELKSEDINSESTYSNIYNKTENQETVDITSPTTTDSIKTTSSNTEDEENIFQDFINTISVMKDNSDYESFLSIYKGKTFKDYYLESGKTEEDWNDLSTLDSFIHYIAYIYPYSCINGSNPVTTKTDFFDKLNATKSLLSTKQGGEVIYNSIEKLWSYLWDNWKTYGVFINFFNDVKYENTDTMEDNTNISGKTTSSETLRTQKNDIIDKKTNITQKENVDNLQTTEENSNKDKSHTSNKALKALKDNLLTIIITIVVGISILKIRIGKRRNAE